MRGESTVGSCRSEVGSQKLEVAVKQLIKKSYGISIKRTGVYRTDETPQI